MILQAIVMALLGLIWHPTWEIFVLLEMPVAGLLIGPALDLVSDVTDAVDNRNSVKGLHKRLAEEEQLVLTSIDPADRWTDEDDDEAAALQASWDDDPDPDDGERAPAASNGPAIVTTSGNVVSLDKYRKAS